MFKNMSQDKFAGGQEVKANWYKFEVVGEGIKGTLLSKRVQISNDPMFSDQLVCEIQTEDEGVMNIGISVKKDGTVKRLNNCKLGEIIGVLFEKEGEQTPDQIKKKLHPAKYLKVLSFGMDPNYNAMSGGEEVGGEEDNELPQM